MTGARRLHTVAAHCIAATTTEPETDPIGTTGNNNTAAVAEAIGFASFPIVDPLGSDINLDELIATVTGITNRGWIAGRPRGLDLDAGDTVAEQAAAFEGRMKQFREVKDQAMEMAKATGEWPEFLQSGRPGPATANPLINHPGVEAHQSANLEEMVAHNRAGTVPTPWAPHVINAHATFAEEGRFERECEMFRTEAAFAGIASDLPATSSFKRLTQMHALGRYVLMTRDSDGTFRAFEDSTEIAEGATGSLEDGATAGLTELPAAERAGILYIIATPCSEEHAAAAFNQICPPDLEAELSTYNLGKHHDVIQQDFTIDSNWKLPIDTFGETYHFSVSLFSLSSVSESL